MATMNDLTQQAIAALDRQDNVEAQRLFRQNIKENPCLATLNNLGYFYIENGIYLPDGKYRNAYKLGMQYLQKASRCGIDYKNRMALGHFAMREKDYPTAGRFYADAISALSTREARYNLAVALYWQEQYSEALSIFENLSAEPLTDDDDEFRNDLRIGIIFCHFYLGERDKAFQLLSSQDAETVREELGMYNFGLAYLCGKMDSVREIYLELEKRWTHYVPELTMMYDCFSKLGHKEEALERVNTYFEDHEWMTKKQISVYKQEIADPEKRKQLIERFHFGIAEWQPCYFIGCSEHPGSGFQKKPN